MTRNEKNYAQCAGALFCLYFLMLCVLKIHELSKAEQVISQGWYFLAALLGLGAFLCAGWMVLSQANHKSTKEVISKSGGIKLFGIGISGALVACLCSFGFAGSIPEVSAPVAVVSDQEDSQEAEEVYHAPIPDPFPVKPVDNLIDQATGAVEISDAQTLSSTYTSDAEGQSVIAVKDQGALTLSNATVRKTGQSDADNALQYGLNSAVIVTPGGSANILQGNIYTDAWGAPGLAVNGDSASASAADVLIQTKGDVSPAVLTAFQGQLHLSQCQLYTKGASCAGMIVQSNSVMSVDSTICQTDGPNSPVVFVSGTYSATGLNANALNSHLAVIEPGADMTLTNSDISAAGVRDDTLGLIVFENQSSLAKNEAASLSMDNTEILVNPTSAVVTTAPAFNVIGCEAKINLTRNTISMTSGIILTAESGKAIMSLDGQSLYGKIQGDANSTLDLSLTNSSSLSGTINTDNTCPSAKLSLDASSKLVLTGDMYLSEFENADASNSNIQAGSYHIYVNGTQVL